MSERKDEEWLDDQLRQAVNGARPVFDAESWKQKYAKEYRVLTARGRSVPAAPPARRWAPRTIWIGWAGKLAVAAAIIVAFVLFFGRKGHETGGPVVPPPPARQSPAKMVSMMALATAYRQGGEDALNRQLDAALNKLGPRPNGFSAVQVLSDLEG